MIPVSIWFRSLGRSARVSVEGKADAERILDRLCHALGIHRGSLVQGRWHSDQRYSMVVNYDSQVSAELIERLIANMKGVRLMAEPA